MKEIAWVTHQMHSDHATRKWFSKVSETYVLEGMTLENVERARNGILIHSNKRNLNIWQHKKKHQTMAERLYNSESDFFHQKYNFSPVDTDCYDLKEKKWEAES